MQWLDPQDKSLVSNFSCKVPQTISTVKAEFEVVSVAMNVTMKKSFLELRTCSNTLLLDFLSVFSHTCTNCYKTQVRTPISLKFGTQKGSPKANSSIKFDANPMNGEGFMINYSRTTRSICCHAYRVNRFME